MTKKVNCLKHGDYVAESLAKAGDEIIWTKCPECIKEQISKSNRNIELYEEMISIRKRLNELELQIGGEHGIK